MNPLSLFGILLILLAWLAAYKEPHARRPALFTVLTGVALLGIAWGLA